MAGLDEDVPEEQGQPPRGFSVLKQRIDLDLDFARQTLRGSTEITIQPLIKDLREISLHCAQCRPTSVKAGGITARFDYDDPYRRVRRHENSTVHQHEMLESKIRPLLRPAPEPTLLITLPSKLKIQELRVDPITALPQYSGIPSLQRQESDAMALAETPTVTTSQPGLSFSPIKLFIEYEVDVFYTGIHWIGVEDGDKRFPYCYTTPDYCPGATSSFVPCVDDATSRCTWEISIRAPKTLGHAFRRPLEPSGTLITGKKTNSAPEAGPSTVDHTGPSSVSRSLPKYYIDLGEADAELDLTVVCVGEQIDDIPDSEDEGFHTVSFSLQEPTTARHVGFAVGPFQRVELSLSRDAEEEERLGQSAVKVEGYCMPGRADELRNTCLPITKALDYFGVNYGSYPFPIYSILFVDDLVNETMALAGISLCSSNLLFGADIIEPLEKNTRQLILSLAEQWMGVNVIPQTLADTWAVAGIANFMADFFGKTIFGNNAYRWQQKLAAERVYELDVDRPSIHQQGRLIHLDRTIREFISLKSALVLFILDRRLMKANGSSGLGRIINRIFLHAKTGSLYNGELSSADFQRTCEKLGHNKLEAFFRQWVYGAGCPIFFVTQKFNKKKLVVEMTIVQKQLERVTKPAFEPSVFMREVKEHVKEVWAPEIQPVFTGPMTIRIHEADGTPYEHIVEIKEATTRLEIPYNTKYKRLKRSRRQKERTVTDGSQGEGGEDALLYCLGDILDSADEVRDWNLADWTTEDEEKMGQESYEWIRIDADFEWIGKIHLVMPLYMYISQLQQDRDLVAQYESMRYLLGSNPHHVSLTILVRTLMDHRYFHGIRSMAAEGLATLSKEKEGTLEIGQFHLEKAFEELFCFPGEVMPRPNDWVDRTRYIIQCAIPHAMSRLRNADNKVPMRVRKFFVDKLKFNDNSNNDYSDCHYVAKLMQYLTDTLVASHRDPEPSYSFNFGEDEPMVEAEDPDAAFEKQAVVEIERYRRIDEWITTYQNLYSTTALKCLTRLTKAGIVKDKSREVLQYTRHFNADLVRLEAFKCLVDGGLAHKTGMLQYLLQSIADDSSPFFRDRLTRIFGEALGHVALGDAEPTQAQRPAPNEAEAETGLILEQEVSSEAKQFEVIRKTTPEGAILALKKALEHDDNLKTYLWYATTSRHMTLDETAAFCDIAALLYTSTASCLAIVKLPRSWRCERVGKGIVRFFPYGAHRIIPKKPLALDDWQQLRELGLKYTGMLSVEVKKAMRAATEESRPLKLMLPQSRRPSISLDAPTTPAIVLATPSTEKSGFKLNLGMKRKQSMDPLQNTLTPKTPKLANATSPNGSIALSKVKSVNSAPRRPSISLKVESQKKSLIVKIPISIKLSHKIATMFEKAGLNGTKRSEKIAKSPSPYAHDMNAYASDDPFFAPNFGGFRAFDGTTTSPDELTRGSPDIYTGPGSAGYEGSSSRDQAQSAALASSPEAVKADMPPPPKPKKLTLKLGPRSNSTGGMGSP